QELALARESRQRELHELRLEQAREKLRRQPKAQPDSAHSEPPEPPEPAESAEDAALRALESLMNAPTPVTEEDFLRSKLSQAPNGFVSQDVG
ncbi:MAG: hypothetical protein KJZ70_05675, partial [Bryobacterales bacterium]|nr:hypothetical protein [Bryobacterales bacterium]